MLEPLANTEERKDLLLKTREGSAANDEKARAIKVITQAFSPEDDRIGGCKVRLCPSCLEPTIARLAICICCHAEQYSVGYILRNAKNDNVEVDEETRKEEEEETFAQEKANVEDTPDEEDQGVPGDAASDVGAADNADTVPGEDDPESQAQGGDVPEYQKWAFKDHTFGEWTTFEEPEYTMMYTTARCLEINFAVALYFDFVYMKAIRTVWQCAERLSSQSLKELWEKNWQLGQRHDCTGGNWPRVEADPITGRPRDLKYADLVEQNPEDYKNGNPNERFKHRWHMYPGQKELVKMAAEAIDMGYTKLTFAPRPDPNDESTFDRTPLHRVIRQVSGCKYYVYFRKDIPVASAFQVPMQDIVHTLGKPELSADALKVCFTHGLFLMKWMMENDRGRR